MDTPRNGTVIIDDGYSKVKRDLANVIIIGAQQDTPREVLAMGETFRLLSAIPADEAHRVATWLAAKFPQPPF